MTLIWHAQPTALALRLLPGGVYGARYSAIVDVSLLACGWAYVGGMLRTDGADLCRRDFRELVAKLRREYGVDTILMARVRNGKPRMEVRHFPDATLTSRPVRYICF